MPDFHEFILVVRGSHAGLALSEARRCWDEYDFAVHEPCPTLAFTDDFRGKCSVAVTRVQRLSEAFPDCTFVLNFNGDIGQWECGALHV